MADRYNDTESSNLTTALGGTVTANDRLFIAKWASKYSLGTDLTAFDLLAVNFLPGWTGDIGTSATPAKFVVNQTSTGVLKLNGSGRLAFISSAAGPGVIYRFVMDSAPCQLTLETTDTEEYVGLAGNAEIKSTADVNKAYISGGSHIFNESGPTMAELQVFQEGHAASIRNMTVADVFGRGRLEVLKDTVAATTLKVRDQALVVYAGAVPTTIELYGGVLDLTRITRPWTVNRKVFGPARIRLAKNGPAITWTDQAPAAAQPVLEYV